MTNQTYEWLTVREAAAHARCGVKTLYREVVAGRLQAARVGGRRALRFKAEWVDAWLERSSEIVLVSGPMARREQTYAAGR